MDALEKWMIILFTPYQTTTIPMWMYSQKLMLKSTLLLNRYCGIQVHTFSNQRWRPLPSLLSLSFIYNLSLQPLRTEAFQWTLQPGPEPSKADGVPNPEPGLDVHAEALLHPGGYGGGVQPHLLLLLLVHAARSQQLFGAAKVKVGTFAAAPPFPAVEEATAAHVRVAGHCVTHCWACDN